MIIMCSFTWAEIFYKFSDQYRLSPVYTVVSHTERIEDNNDLISGLWQQGGGGGSPYFLVSGGWYGSCAVSGSHHKSPAVRQPLTCYTHSLAIHRERGRYSTYLYVAPFTCTTIAQTQSEHLDTDHAQEGLGNNWHQIWLYKQFIYS